MSDYSTLWGPGFIPFDNPTESLLPCPTLEALREARGGCYRNGSGCSLSHYGDILLIGRTVTRRPFFLGLTPKRELVTDLDLAHPPHRSLYPGVAPEEISASESGTAIQIEKGFSFLYPWIGNYQHYLAEVYPRLALYLELLEHDPDLPLIIQSNLPPFISESLQFLGISNTIKLDPEQVSQIEHLYVASPPAVDFVSTTECFYRFYAALADKIPHSSSPLRRIYISRRDLQIGDGKRRVLENELDVVNCFLEHGFNEIRLEQYPFAEKLMLFRQAEVIAGPSGAGLFTSVIAKRDALLLPIMHPLTTPNWYHLAFREGPRNLRPIQCASLAEGAEAKDPLSRWRVDLSQLKHDLLENLGTATR